MSAKIRVVGIGGAGNNVVNRMIGIVNGVEFIAVNTDTQDLGESKADHKIAIGQKTTKGLGSGGDPSIGQKSAEESIEQIKEALEGSDLVFITAGMGGGTGTGAAPIVAMIARELGILTVSVVTKPFEFEGKHRARNAEIGISNLSKFVDCNIIVPNQKLVDVSKPNTTMLEAFAIADDILRQGVQCITDLIVKNMTINIDFADIAAVMRNSGIAHMGIGEASGENRVLKAIQQAIHSPILETSIKRASQIIVSVMGGVDLSIQEVSNYGMLIKDVLDENVNMIFGADLNPALNGKVQIIIIATGFPPAQAHVPPAHAGHPHAPVDTHNQVQSPKIIEQSIHIPTHSKHDDDNLPPYIRKMRGK